MTASVSAGTVFLAGSFTLLYSEAPDGHSVAESSVYTMRGPMVCSSIISSVSQFLLACRPFSVMYTHVFRQNGQDTKHLCGHDRGDSGTLVLWARCNSALPLPRNKSPPSPPPPPPPPPLLLLPLLLLSASFTNCSILCDETFQPDRSGSVTGNWEGEELKRRRERKHASRTNLPRSPLWSMIDYLLIQIHKRFKRTPFIRTRQNQQMFGVISFVKLQNDT